MIVAAAREIRTTIRGSLPNVAKIPVISTNLVGFTILLRHWGHQGPRFAPKSWELHAAMSMARLWRDQGKPEEARELLAPVYGWFIEGVDTLGLKDAKALLDELRA
jgi:hypothetical protein